MMDINTEKYKEVRKLSLLAKTSGIINFFVGGAVLALAIVFGSENGMNILSLFISIMVGYSWYRGANLIFMSKDMLAFASIEDYMQHIKNESNND